MTLPIPDATRFPLGVNTDMEDLLAELYSHFNGTSTKWNVANSAGTPAGSDGFTISPVAAGENFQINFRRESTSVCAFVLDPEGSITDSQNAAREFAHKITCTNTATWDLSGGKSLTYKLDGGPEQTASVVDGDFATPSAATASEVASALHTAMAGATVTVSGSQIQIRTDTERVHGGGRIEITGGDMNDELGFPTTSPGASLERENLGCQTAGASNWNEYYLLEWDDAIFILGTDSVTDTSIAPGDYFYWRMHAGRIGTPIHDGVPATSDGFGLLGWYSASGSPGISTSGRLMDVNSAQAGSLLQCHNTGDVLQDWTEGPCAAVGWAPTAATVSSGSAQRYQVSPIAYAPGQEPQGAVIPKLILRYIFAYGDASAAKTRLQDGSGVEHYFFISGSSNGKEVVPWPDNTDPLTM